MTLLTTSRPAREVSPVRLPIVVTRVEIQLATSEKSHRKGLRAYVDLEINGGLVIEEARLIESSYGFHVSMPSRKATLHCTECKEKNHIKARYCNGCGTYLPSLRLSAPLDLEGKPILYHDVAFPINQSVRDAIESAVKDAYAEAVRAESEA